MKSPLFSACASLRNTGRVFARSLGIALCAAILSLSAVSCTFEPDNTDEPVRQAPTVSVPFLEGTWESPTTQYGYDGFSVTGTAFSYQYNGEEQFSGEIVNVHTLSDANTSGYLTLKLKTVSSDYTLVKDSYYVVYWENLTDTSVEEASPYKAGGSNNGFATQAEAEAEYTVTNGYFGYTGTYTKK
ncbi:MAG TPA: hypothetical protein PKH40_10190 [Treponemataceae bacterium]|nr:hypothetical protein [Treponemataceae bacterium]